MILVIDNYDSFTWNLVHYLQELGAGVEVVRNDAMSAGQALSSGAQAFLISPGPKTPDDAGVSLDLVAACAREKRPLLGVCLGMQLLADASMEGVTDAQGVPGLGLVPGRVEHLRTLGCLARVPHVGWNAIAKTPTHDHLFNGIPDGTDFYFVHSYAFLPADTNDILAFADYGVPVTAAVLSKAVLL